MADYLPPAVLRLVSEFDPKGIVEAKKGVDSLTKYTDESLRKQSATAADEGKKTGKAFGEAIPKAAKPGLDRLERDVRESGRRAGHGLAGEFERSVTHAGGSAGVTLGGMFKTIFSTNTLKSLFSKASWAGIQAGDAFSEGFKGGLLNIAKAAWPVLLPMAVGLAAELAADIGGALEGALALGGLITGAMVQIKTNPEVQRAAKDFGHWFTDQFKEGTASFAGPLIDAFSILKSELTGPLGDLKQDFAYLAPYVRDFAMYLGAAVEKFMPGFNRAVQSSGPIIQELGKGLVYVADGLNIMFDEISKGGKGEVEALDTLFRVIGAAAAATGFFIRVSAGLYDSLVKVAKVVNDVVKNFTPLGIIIQKVIGWDLSKYIDGISRSFSDGGPAISGYARAVNDAGRQSHLTADDLKELSGQVGETAVTVDTLAAQMVQKLFTATMGVDEATLQWHEALTSLRDTLAENGTQIDKHTDSINLNTKKGQQNESAILAAVRANMAAYQSWIAVGGSAQDAAKQYDVNTTALVKQMQQAGYTSKEIEGLIGKYRGIPDTVNTQIATQGLADAIDGLSELLAQINGIWSRRLIDIEVRSRINTPGSFGHIARGAAILPGGVIRAAEGLLPPRNPGTLVLAGEPETGGEVMIPLRGISAVRAAMLAQYALAPYGLGVTSQKGPSRAALSALSGPGGGGRGGAQMVAHTGGGGYVPIVVQLGGTQMAALHAKLIPVAQRYRIRTGSTGLETPPR